MKLQFFDVNHERIVAIRSMAASRRSVAGVRWLVCVFVEVHTAFCVQQKKMEAKHLDSVVRKHSERTNEVRNIVGFFQGFRDGSFV